MLELLAQVDPMAIPLWAVVLFAAGMYPIGIMLGSDCSPCCNRCGCPPEQTLPDTVTVTLSGYEDGQVQGPNLATLTFTSNFGSGAAGIVTAPGGTPGPITAVELTEGGGEYARQTYTRVAPTVTASASGGSGAQFSVDIAENGTTPETWSVTAVSVINGGSGYPASGWLTFSVASGDTIEEGASVRFYSGRTQPIVSASDSGTGSGATFSVSLSSDTDFGGRTFWYVSGISVTDGGGGYTEGDSVFLYVTDGQVGDFGGPAYATVASVDEDGAITAVNVDFGGEYYKSNGVIATVEFLWYGGGGIYYRDDPTGVETATVTVGVSQAVVPGAGALLSAVIDDNPSSPTFGQIVDVTIEDGGDGYVAWLYRNIQCCADYWNEMTVVLQRSTSNPCLYSHSMCGTSCGTSVTVEYRGPSAYPLVRVNTSQQPSNTCAVELTGTTLVESCNQFSFTATDQNGVTAEVVSGGDYDPEYKADNGTGRCFPCCRGEGDPPDEIELEYAIKGLTYDENGNLVESDWSPDPVFVGGATEIPIYVLPRRRILGGCDARWAGGPAGWGFFPLVVWIEECNDPLKANCDHCWKQCVTRVRVYTGRNCRMLSGSDHGTSSGCVGCDESPICAPKAGEYIITESSNPSATYNGQLCDLIAIRATIL